MFKGVEVKDNVSFKKACVIDNVCHGREGYPKDFFYMYITFFIQLHIRLPFDKFTMGVWHILNIAPTQLHPNN